LQSWSVDHIITGMKITLNIDDGLLERVMKASGIHSKTGVIDHVMREWDRRYRLKKLSEIGLGFTDEQVANAFDPNYDLMALRLAETPIPYGEKPSAS
jgi:Bacterial antitoxin of type II TA system, VapB